MPGYYAYKSVRFLSRGCLFQTTAPRYLIPSRRFNHLAANLPLPENSPAPQILNPHLYCSLDRSWRPSMSAPGQRLNEGSLLRVVSWNIDFKSVGRATRASSAIDHLGEVLGDPSSPLVVMLQEVHHESLSAILEHPWIRENFVLSNVDAPQRYFTLIMVSQHIQTEGWFRVPLQSRMNRDALVVDIPIFSPNREAEQPKKILRLCTTHLESLWEAEGEERRPCQLAQISALLKAPPTSSAQIIGGLVGGDMNHISPVDIASRKAGNVNLCDVWEDTVHPPAPILRPFQKDLTFGKAKGNTWGYQTPNAHSRKRLDKFFYSGMVGVVPLAEARDLTGNIGRLGIGLKSTVKTWEYEIERLDIVRGKFVMKTDKYHKDTYHKGGTRKDLDIWVSDHFGIAIGIRVR